MALKVIHVFEIADREVRSWMNSFIRPLEAQVNAYQEQANSRIEGMARIRDAESGLVGRIDDMQTFLDESTSAPGNGSRTTSASRGSSTSTRRRTVAASLGRRAFATPAATSRSDLRAQLALRLAPLGIERDAIHGADLAALRRVEVPDALGALRGVDHVDLLARRDGAVRGTRARRRRS